MPISTSDYAEKIMDEITEDYEGDTPEWIFLQVAHEIYPKTVRLLEQCRDALKGQNRELVIKINKLIKDLER